jgi:hypothetical protein
VRADKTNNITVSVDPSTWFGSGTTFLDPRVEANKAGIESNIKASVTAFEDDDKSGHENHGGAAGDKSASDAGTSSGGHT